MYLRMETKSTKIENTKNARLNFRQNFKLFNFSQLSLLYLHPRSLIINPEPGHNIPTRHVAIKNAAIITDDGDRRNESFCEDDVSKLETDADDNVT